MDIVRAAFSLTPEYLKTVGAAASVRNLMDTGIQLGRRFRALKLWMVLRHFGAEGIRAIGSPSTCGSRGSSRAGWMRVGRLRARRAGAVQRRLFPRLAGNATRFNAALLERLNASGEVFLSHTKLDGRYTLRLAIGNLHTTERHVARAWELIQQLSAELKADLERARLLRILREISPEFPASRSGSTAVFPEVRALHRAESSAGSHHAPAATR